MTETPARPGHPLITLSRRGLLALGGAAGVAGLLSPAASAEGTPRARPAVGSGTIRALFMKQAGYSEENINEMISSFQAANEDLKVKPDFVAYEALHDKIVAAAPAGTYDVVLIDVIWPAEFGTKKIVADVTGRWSRRVEDRTCSAARSTTAQHQDKFYGVPWILDTKYLFANTAHLTQAGVDAASLTTWDGVLDAAKALKSPRGSSSTRWSGAGSRPRRWSATTPSCSARSAARSSTTPASRPSTRRRASGAGVHAARRSSTSSPTRPPPSRWRRTSARCSLRAGRARAQLDLHVRLANDPAESPRSPATSGCSAPRPDPASRPGVNGCDGPLRHRRQQEPGRRLDVHRVPDQRVRPGEVRAQLRSRSGRSSYDDPQVIETNPAVVPVAKEQLADLILRPAGGELQRDLPGPAGRAAERPARDKDPQKALDDAASQATSLLGAVRLTSRWPCAARPATALRGAAAVRAGSPCCSCCRRRWSCSASCSTPWRRTLVVSLYDVDQPHARRLPLRRAGQLHPRLRGQRVLAARRATRLYFTVVSTVAGTGARASRLALLLNAPLRARWLLRGIVVLPWALPTIVNGAMWRWILNAQYGVLNGLLTQLAVFGRVPTPGSGSPFLALNMVVVADVWKNTSLVAFFLLAGLQTIPRRTVRGGPRRRRRAGQLVLAAHSAAARCRPSPIVLVLRTIEAFKVFDIVYVMTGGGPASGTQTVTFFTYLQAFS